MQGQWLLVLDLYLMIPLSHTFNPIGRGHVSEGGLSDIHSQGAVFLGGIQRPPCCVNLNETANIPSGGIEYHPVVSESERLSTYMGLDDYDTSFEARHGRGALDHVPRTSGGGGNYLPP